ncbi:hypothetical protein ACFPVX_02225 [Cohnella faecalis]|uniref:Uncharacterized protein n=1 Tax=Cohnella faecalis TaxID=2315694 RepID=A0A398CW91_9BACL|nr:hypothetical protein [Cohnella faecalis]RIE04818.1 hypothetical protein D3H35_04940 [Cohnella faecalis]
MHEHSDSTPRLAFHFSTVKLLSPDSMLAVPLGQGIMHKAPESEWVQLDEGLPDDTHVNRLQVYGEDIYACTNQGLFKREENWWTPGGLGAFCYQFKQVGRVSLAGTSNGLWCKDGNEWRALSCSGRVVYDFLYLPHFIVIGMDLGLSIYDRLAQAWMNFRLNVAVTSLIVSQGVIMGATEKGELLIGNRKGGFERYKFGSLFVFNVVNAGNESFACTDKGLYRISRFRNAPRLMAVKLGCQVTDVDSDGESLYIATLFQGVQKI